MNITLAILIVSGFTVRESDDSGMRRLYKVLRDQYAGPDAYVMMREWDASWEDVARILDVDLSKDSTVIYIGHSYGGGVAFPQFADKVHRTIDLACLIDPVPRAIRWLGIPTLLHLIGLSRDRIHLPRNVRAAIAWRQDNNRPTGRALKHGASQTVTGTVYGPGSTKREPYENHIVDRKVCHDTIDSLPAVHSTIKDRVGSLVDARMGR